MAVTGSALDSRLELEFAANEEGVTRLVRRQAGGLCHIGKPYWNGEVLLTQWINPTAGFFAGDRLEAEIELGPGASVLLSNPSATRLHTMAGGRSEMSQTFRLAAGSFLEIHPELMIPQANSSRSVRTRIELEGNASLFFLDLLAPGRTAHGESLAWREFASATDIFRDGELLIRERARIAPASHGWKLRMPGGAPAYAAICWLSLPRLEDFGSRLEAFEDSLEDEGVIGGVSELADGFGVVRLLAAESVRLRRACAALRRQFATVVPQLRARTGKL